MYAKEVDQMKKRLVYLLFPTVTLLLGLLPGGTAVVNADPGGHYETLYPYFAFTPVLAGEPVPLIVALSVFVTAVLIVVWCMSGSYAAGNGAKYLQLAALGASLPALFGRVTLPALLISIWLAVGAAVMFLTIKNPDRQI